MFRVFGKSSLVVVAFATASCETVRDTYAVSNKLVERPPEEMGVVVGSIGVAKSDIG